MNGEVMMHEVNIPGLGKARPEDGARYLEACADGFHHRGQNGVREIISTGDGKVEFIAFENNTLAYVKSELGYPAYYPVLPISRDEPVRAVLMDLDGTSVRSEEFWIYIIGLAVGSLIEKPGFELEQADIPFVSGHSVSEHLQYCIDKYCHGKKLEEARIWYYRHTNEEMEKISRGKGRADAFTPTAGLKDFLLELKSRKIKIALVTSGLYEKAWPEILSAFRTLGMGDPAEFYDAVITAGYPLRKNSCGTLGELMAKPHPWLYAEAATVGLNIGFGRRGSVIGIEDSGAGVCSVRLAGYTTIGISGGNIQSSGTRFLCDSYAENLEDILLNVL